MSDAHKESAIGEVREILLALKLADGDVEVAIRQLTPYIKLDEEISASQGIS
jgi:hypothetical protein